MHPDADRIQRLVDGELSPHEAVATEAHLDGCATCRRRVDEVRAADAHLFGLLETLDHPPPRVAVARVVQRATRRRLRWGSWSRRVAGVVLALTVGTAAMAAPRSPVRRWITAIRAAVAPATAAPESARDASLSPSAQPEPDYEGVGVSPGALLTIQFEGSIDGGAVRVRWTDAAEVVVRAPTGAATFTADADRLVVVAARATEFDLVIPRSALRVEVRSGDRLLFSTRRSEVTVDGLLVPAGRGDTPWRIELSRHESGRSRAP